MFGRHSLVWLSDDGWQTVYDHAAADVRPAIVQWRRADRPAVVRRADVDADDSQVCAGIALPPDATGIKKRIPLRIPAAYIRRAASPIRLEVAMPCLPRQWQQNLAALTADAAAQCIVFRVYGSAAMQSLTGLEYVTAASDIDLLFRPATEAELDAGLRLLAMHSHLLPLDGEVIFPCGGAVAWKEWINAMDSVSQPRVLVKENRNVRLLKTSELLHKLERETCMNH